MKHPPERREKLQRAGLSLESDLRPDQIERLDGAPADASGRTLRELTMNGGVMKERRPTVGAEAVRLLQERGPMHYRDLAQHLINEGKVKTGKTFAQTLSAELARRPDTERVAPGVYKAKED